MFSLLFSVLLDTSSCYPSQDSNDLYDYDTVKSTGWHFYSLYRLELHNFSICSAYGLSLGSSLLDRVGYSYQSADNDECFVHWLFFLQDDVQRTLCL